MDKTWASRIADLESRGWTLAEIAAAIGKSPQTVSDIKQGRTKEPGGMAAVRLFDLHNSGARPPSAAA